MNINATVDTRAFESAIQALSKASGVSIPRVVEYEAGKVLEAASKNTKSALPAKIKTRHAATKFTSANLGHGRKVYNLAWRYPGATWRALQKKRNASLRRKLAARGLSKQSWHQLAAAAGLDITVPGYVAKALASTGKTYPENAVAQRIGSGGNFSLRFVNSQPTVEFAGGRAALQRAINGRSKFFAMSLKKGVFNDLKQVAARYPGLRVS